MKIQIGKVFLNKTYKYLRSCLKEYGKDFENKINSIYKVAFGIGDFILVKSGIKYEQHLFILVDSKMGLSYFKKFLNWIRTQSYYADDYAFDDLERGQLHMIVIKVPDKYQNALVKFKLGEYSQMYTIEDINFLFEEDPDVMRTLIRDHEYVIKFVNEVNEIFDSSVNPSEWEGEIDFKPNLKEEIFNE